jgi:hypothetical protein
MMKKEAIAISPYDPWEKSIQDAAKQATGNWLPSYPCQLLAKTIASLKCGTDWMENEELREVRASYFFAPYLISNQHVRVFITHFLYLRDILENRQINSVLHNPIAFLTKPLAYFLFRDHPVHISFKDDLLRTSNKKTKKYDVGGLMIVPEGDVNFEEEAVVGVSYFGKDGERVQSLIEEIKQESGYKIAATEIQPDVFEIGEHFRAIEPGASVWNKRERAYGKVQGVEPSENGAICVEYDGGSISTISKEEFDQQFVVV